MKNEDIGQQALQNCNTSTKKAIGISAGIANSIVELTISDCTLEVINLRCGRRKEFAIWYGNRELGPEASRQAASKLLYHNDKFQGEDSARDLGFAMLIFSISRIASHCRGISQMANNRFESCKSEC